MSGGNYNYLYLKHIDDAINSEDWESMKERVREIPEVAHVVKIMGDLEEAEQKLQERYETICPLLRAIEWRDSGDLGDESLGEWIKEWLREQDKESA